MLYAADALNKHGHAGQVAILSEHGGIAGNGELRRTCRDYGACMQTLPRSASWRRIRAVMPCRCARGRMILTAPDRTEYEP